MFHQTLNFNFKKRFSCHYAEFLKTKIEIGYYGYTL